MTPVSGPNRRPHVERLRTALSRRARWRVVAVVLLAGVAATVAGSRVLHGAAGMQQPLPADVSPQAMAQIDALLQEKATWSPVQQKIDSQLLIPVKRARNERIADGVPMMAAAMQVDANGLIVVDVRAAVSDRLLADLRGLGAEVISSYPAYRDVRLRVAANQVEAIAALPDVIFVQPKQEALTQRAPMPAIGAAERRRQVLSRSVWNALQGRSGGVVTNAGAPPPVTSEGDLTHRAAEMRLASGFNGTGVKIGVLSDGVAGLTTNPPVGGPPPRCVAAPAPGCVTILPGQAGPTTTGSAEGTAMLEVIHDLAPGAQLYFATGLNGLSSFAQNISDLSTIYQCDIIVDDVGYFVESPFQDGQNPGIVSQTNGGVVIQAVKDAVANGALYFSAAGNSGNLNKGTSGTWEGDFADGGPTSSPLTIGGRVHSFGAQTYNALMMSGLANNLFWSDPLGGSTNDYDLFLLNSTGTTVLAASINVQNGAQPQDPYEQVAAGAPGDRLVIVKYSGVGRFLHLGTIRGRLSSATSGETHGHAATSAANSFGVAATAAMLPGPDPNPFNSSGVVELFNSDGPRRIFFDSAGTALTPGNVSATGGQVLNKPDITAADAVSVSGSGGFTSIFRGTSAAAPHAAAIAALIKSTNLGLSAGDVSTALLSSAIDIEAPGVDWDSGAGIVMALSTPFLGAVAPTITTQPQDLVEIDFGTATTLRVAATGTVPLSFQWYQGSSGDASTPVGTNAPQFTTPSLTISANYWVRVSNSAGTVDSDAAQITVVPITVRPVITGQPSPEIGVLSGHSASIGVAATGLGLSYQWYQGVSGDASTPIGGATSAGFTTPALIAATNYWVLVSNGAGSVNSDTALVSVGTGPTINVQPANVTISCGQVATISVTASGTPFPNGSLGYQWFAGPSGSRASPIAGVTSSSFTTTAIAATSQFWVRVSNPFDATSSTTATVTVNPGPNCVPAAYDSVLKAPKCGVAGSVCDAGDLLLGVASSEPHQPNTILNSCADGPLGIFHSDESIDALRISTTDGSPFAPGKTARIEATVFVFLETSDFLDLYYATDATNPSWTYLTTLSPSAPGSQTLSATYTLPVGSLQAVRAGFRFGGSHMPCSNGAFDDHDDLIFAVNPVAGTELVQNGNFSNGLANWLLWEAPDIVHNSAAGGVFQYHKANPPPTASGQAVIFQQTGAQLGAGTPLTAQFDIGNADSLRKRIAVLVLDSDFTDLSVCTFWLPASAPLRTYQMKTHATKAWANASIYFYAASDGLGDYRLDNVSLKPNAAGSTTRTDCIDPAPPSASGGPDGPDLLTNGDFSAGTIAPWGTFFSLVSQLSGGVFEFNRPTAGAMGPGVLQTTGQPMSANQILTSTFQLGNSSSVRKRVTVLLHDLDFTDLSACSFWIPAGQPLSTYTMRSFTTKAWANATISFYAASIGPEQWTRLDNVTFQRTPGATALGTECIEPTVLGTFNIQAEPNAAPAAAPAALTSTTPVSTTINTSEIAQTLRPRLAGSSDESSGATAWRADAWTSLRAILQWADPIDLTQATFAQLNVNSWLLSLASSAEVQVSLDGISWQSIARVPPTGIWTTLEVDLSQFLGQSVYLRFVFDGVAPAPGVMPDFWMIDDVTVVRRPDL